MRGSFWMNLLEGFLAVGFIGGATVDIVYRGVSWQGGALWVLGGLGVYGLYRFYARGGAVQSEYQERWNRTFDGDASD